MRAADVCLKERRPLVLMPRETPLHTGHCKLLYEASQLGAIVAPALADQPRVLDALLNEVRQARRVSHRHVCRVYDIGEVDELLFLSMEYLEGLDLGQLETFPRPLVLGIVERVSPLSRAC